jgi:hypothetical protein
MKVNPKAAAPPPPPPPPGPAAKDTTPPVVTAFRVTNPVFAALAAAKKKKAKKGTRFTFKMSEAAQVKIGIASIAKGLRSGKRCVKPTTKLRKRKAKKCNRFLARGSLRFAGKPGSNSRAFSGKLGRTKLKPGRYRATIVATDAAGNKSTPRTAQFTVVRR